MILITPPGGTCAADPRLTAPVAGEDYCFESVSNTLKRWDGSQWIPLPGVANVRDFGAKGDGVTDDTVAIGLALTAAAAANAGLLFPAGTYLTSPFTIPTTLRAIYGESPTTTTIKIKTGSYSANQRMIDGRNNTAGLRLWNFSISVDGSAFDGTWTLDLTGGAAIRYFSLALTGSATRGITFDGGTDIAGRDILFTGTNGGFTVGVYGSSAVSNAFQYTVDMVRLTGVHQYGVQFGGDGVRTSEGHLMHNCRSDGNSGASFAFSLAGCTYSSIESCYAKNSIHEAFQLTDTLYCTIINCHGEWLGTNGTDYGISVNGTSRLARFNKIIGNTLVNTRSEGIATADWSQYTLVQDNVLLNCGVRQGRAALITYTVTAGAQNINNVFQGNLAVNETGTLTNFFLELQTGGGGALTDLNIAQDNTFRGSLSSAFKYTFVGANSVVFDPEWSAYTPVVTSGTGTITAYTINSAFFRTQGRGIQIQLDITITNNGSGATSVIVTLPVSAAANAGALSGREVALNGITLAGACNGATAILFKYDNTYPGGTNARLVASGIYRF